MSKEVETNEQKKYPSIYEKLQNARVKVQKSGITKGGLNKFNGWRYIELPDFLPQTNLAMQEERLTAIFNCYQDHSSLIIHDWDSDKKIIFRTENADATNMKKDGVTPANLAVQTLGSMQTYLKRYLYLHALEVAESDELDNQAGNPDIKPQKHKTRNQQNEAANEPIILAEVEKATREQIIDVMELFEEERIEKMLAFYKVDGIKDIPKEQLTIAIAKEKSKQALSEDIPSIDDVI